MEWCGSNMIIVSHRGNVSGRNADRENSPSYIDEAISHGYDVEVDVWCINGSYYLGHDEPQHEVTKEWLFERPLWCHAKNASAMEQMMLDGLCCFWHESDKFTLTSDGFLWCFPGNYSRFGVTVHLEECVALPPEFCYGICTDFAHQWRNKWKQDHHHV
jgi:hypothetical protein